MKGKEHWLYFVYPERPVAGADVAVYFNNNVSDILRCVLIAAVCRNKTSLIFLRRRSIHSLLLGFLVLLVCEG